MMKRFLMLALLAVPFLATVAKADDAAAADAKPKKKSHKEKKADKKAAKAAPAPAPADAKPAGGDEMK
jgi:Ni/Co efflux regulator RcnB